MALRSHHQFGRARIALVTAFALIAQPLTPVMGQTPAPKTAAPQTATVPLPSTTAAQKATLAARRREAAANRGGGRGPGAAVDGGWPRAYQTPSRHRRS